ncbi:MAG: FAD-binding protein, partial [Pseudomonadota bacterium]
GVDMVILATGGIGGLYATTTNPRTAVGAGIAMAARAGALIGDAEFVQFHPTAIQSDADPAPLASEALRGEGATLINRDGRRFMAEIHTDAELAPRDVVARAVFTEAQSERGAYLDTRQSIGAAFAEHFPTVYGMCVDNGIDPVHEPIPVIPAEHYHMGGVVTDEDGRTRVPNLFAIGEVACTGLHGANRLASNSLLEAVVFAARAAQAITSDAQPHAHAELKPAEPAPTVGLETREIGQTTIRDIMQSDVGVVRDGDGLRDAVRALGELQEAAGPDRALANMALTARFIAESALRRKESRGGHFRSDYPKPDPALAARKTVTLAGLDLRTGTAARAALTVAANPERGT